MKKGSLREDIEKKLGALKETMEKRSLREDIEKKRGALKETMGKGRTKNTWKERG